MLFSLFLLSLLSFATPTILATTFVNYISNEIKKSSPESQSTALEPGRKRSLPSPFQLPPKLSSTGHGPLPISSSDWGTSSRADGRPKEPHHSTKPTKGATQHFAG
ncbi:hypothetical protein HDV57DRAFT_398021 [Trichoderma longibrachiatum]|uniref:Uncharacterized protein n=1 Tax=Trichoderma longibrachiatum ATCC 18648 TaxID=983965 RepID=A0A2T4BPK8_TRILO|nr:hypothetical protein M440DRAFT_221043 [Trichoderma longibrachiatum ATCC 18648]